MEELVKILNDDGFHVTEVIPDGQMHRFNMDAKDKKKSGFYTAYQNHSVQQGNTFYVVVYGSWRGDETKTYCTLANGKMSRDDKKIVNDKIEQAKRKAEKERQTVHEQASEEVSAIIEKCSEKGQSDYLKRKLVNDCPNLNIKYFNGSIVIPVSDSDGKVWSAQTIFADGRKQFFPNGKISGNFHLIGEVGNSEIVYITEGLATGASIHMATLGPVYISFTAKNLIPVSQSVRELYPDKQIVICADDDRDAKNSKGELYNVGKESAEEAAKRINASVVIPVFTNPEKVLTDFNDVHFKEGLDTVRKQIKAVALKVKMAVYPLGFSGNEFMFTSTDNGQVMTFNAVTETDLLKLMPLEYWEMVFPKSNGGVDWTSAKSKLMTQCRAKGIFENKLVRGSGVWLDQGRVVVNMGDHLIVDGKRLGMRDLRTKFFYTLGPSIPPLPKPLSTEECDVITNAAHLFKWKSEDHGYLLAGAMVIMRVCGALPIRPHVWLTGERATGKSTLFNRFIDPLMGKQAIMVMGNTTEAGIRQNVNANAFPVIFDEFENNGRESAEKIQNTIDLMRAAWSETNAVILKGSATGNSQQYQARFSALVISIRQVALSDADKSRFATIELSPHKGDMDHWRELDTALSLITDEVGDRLFSRAIRLMPVLIENFKILKRELNKSMAGQRFADQYGMLLAGYSILLQNEVISEEQAQMMINHVRLEDAREESTDIDQKEALACLLTTKITVRTSNEQDVGFSFDASIGDLIEKLLTSEIRSPAMINSLLTLGIKVNTDTVDIASPSHAEQNKVIWNSTKWRNSWGGTLSRLDGAIKNVSVRMNGSVKKATRLPKKLFLE